jgi:hypothetical protein
MRPGLLLSLALAVPLHAAVRLQVGDAVPGPSFPLDPHQTRTYYVTASADRGEFNSDVRVDVTPFCGAAIESLTPTRSPMRTTRADPPRIDAAHYDPATDTTTVDFTIFRYWFVDRTVDLDVDDVAFYVNADPRNQGEQIAGSTSVQVDTRPQSFRTTLKGDLSGKWLTATATLHVFTERVTLDPRQSTSEFSNAVVVTK